MAGACCNNCVYSVCDPELWLKLMWLGEPVLAQCANHPNWPGQLHDVPGVACENYRAKPVPPTGDVRMIPLAEGGYAYVDTADYEWLNQWNWHTTSAGYAARHNRGKTVLMHRLIMEPPKGMVVDHIDGNRGNNCRGNLRICTRAENQRNMCKHRRSFSLFKGVYYCKEKDKIFAQLFIDGHVRRIGYYEKETDAARAYDYAAVEAFGEFARVNFPREWPPERRAEVYAGEKREGRNVGRKERTTGAGDGS